MKSKIRRLLESSNKQDIVLAFHLMDGWSETELQRVVPPYWAFSYKDRMKCNYKGDSGHFFLRTKCGVILYASSVEGIGTLPGTHYYGINEFNLYEREDY